MSRRSRKNSGLGQADAAAAYGTALTSQRNSKALLAVSPARQMPPRTTTPTITLTSAVDAATPLQIKANTSSSAIALNPALGLSGYQYTCSGGAFPYYERSSSKPPPSSPAGYGSSTADFACDAPAISFAVTRGELGTLRVFVDGTEMVRVVTALTSGTAQAGAASTITLASGGSAVNGFYVGTWVHITGGTGAGQYAQVTAYVGSTRVATVAPAWTTAPDNTSTYDVASVPAAFSTSTQSGFSNYFLKLDWNGERRIRRYHVEFGGFTFRGVYTTGSIDSVIPAQPADAGVPTFWCGDSFGHGTGADGIWGSLAAICCARMGWRHYDLSIGGTGWLNPGVQSLPFVTRLIPPLNSWRMYYRIATGGSFTVTQAGVTTAAVAYNATLATVQAAFDAAFGAGAFLLVGDSAFSWFALGQGATATVAAPMTVTSSLTGIAFYLFEQYLGEMAPLVPKDGTGNMLPFNIVLQGAHNDTTSSNAAYTTSVLQAAVTSLITGLQALYPTATIFVVGGMFLPGGSVVASLTAADAAILAGCTASLNKINGRVPFVSTLAAGIVTGTGYLGNLKADGNSDLCCTTDGVHPTPFGHEVYGTYLAGQLLGLLNAA